MNEQQLPPLPESVAKHDGGVFVWAADWLPTRNLDYFTADQMREYARAALAANVPQYSDLDGLAHELWAVAQLPPGQGIADGVERIKAVLLQAAPVAVASPWMPIETAPKDDSLLLLKEKWEDEPFIGQWVSSAYGGKWAASRTHYDTDGDACVIDCVYSEGVTHWMPLPPAPEMES